VTFQVPAVSTNAVTAEAASPPRWRQAGRELERGADEHVGLLEILTEAPRADDEGLEFLSPASGYVPAGRRSWTTRSASLCDHE
jgi:hypothetical protein